MLETINQHARDAIIKKIKNSSDSSNINKAWQIHTVYMVYKGGGTKELELRKFITF